MLVFELLLSSVLHCNIFAAYAFPRYSRPYNIKSHRQGRTDQSLSEASILIYYILFKSGHLHVFGWILVKVGIGGTPYIGR